MKKFYFILASLCVILAVSSCSADDLNDTNHDINLNGSVAPQTPGIPTENGDKDDDKDKIGTKD